MSKQRVRNNVQNKEHGPVRNSFKWFSYMLDTMLKLVGTIFMLSRDSIQYSPAGTNIGIFYVHKHKMAARDSMLGGEINLVRCVCFEHCFKVGVCFQLFVSSWGSQLLGCVKSLAVSIRSRHNLKTIYILFKYFGM